jgi:hypothetical protein
MYRIALAAAALSGLTACETIHTLSAPVQAPVVAVAAPAGVLLPPKLRHLWPQNPRLSP